MTDSSQTIIDCLLGAAQKAGVKLKPNCGVESASRKFGNGFKLALSNGELMACDKLLLATAAAARPRWDNWRFHSATRWNRPCLRCSRFTLKSRGCANLAGISVENVEVSVPGIKLRERGALLVTHWGLSGPAILRLSAWGARELHEKNYQFQPPNQLAAALERRETCRGISMARRKSQPAKAIVNLPIAPLPARLWEQLVLRFRCSRVDARWSALSPSGPASIDSAVVPLGIFGDRKKFEQG